MLLANHVLDFTRNGGNWYVVLDPTAGSLNGRPAFFAGAQIPPAQKHVTTLWLPPHSYPQLKNWARFLRAHLRSVALRYKHGHDNA